MELFPNPYLGGICDKKREKRIGKEETETLWKNERKEIPLKKGVRT